ncbi:MAG TPA: uracil-DNA glycosylase [Firmicutes bacterium]|nr:uracil-DNA glycosylase [Bacillota bacterium]
MGIVRLGNDWDQIIGGEFRRDYYRQLRRFLLEEYSTKTIYPDQWDIFAALRGTSYRDCKVVILGQDPYHGPRQAHGLAFSVQPGVPSPPSLRNIFKELAHDLGLSIPDHGCLGYWAKQGVLLLNTVLTVRAGQAASHRGRGWEEFTNAVITRLNAKERPIVFLLWGRQAQSKQALLSNGRHLVLQAAHPSPLSASRGFFGCGHFSKANSFLEGAGYEPIDWQLPPINAGRAGQGGTA